MCLTQPYNPHEIAQVILYITQKINFIDKNMNSVLILQSMHALQNKYSFLLWKIFWTEQNVLEEVSQYFLSFTKIDSKFEIEITGHKVYPVAISRRPDISSFASAGRRLCVVFGPYW